jgi:hypothetical protein
MKVLWATYPELHRYPINIWIITKKIDDFERIQKVKGPRLAFLGHGFE